MDQDSSIIRLIALDESIGDSKELLDVLLAVVKDVDIEILEVSVPLGVLLGCQVQDVGDVVLEEVPSLYP